MWCLEVELLNHFIDDIYNKHSAINNCWSVKNSVVLHKPSSRDSVFDSVDSFDFLLWCLEVELLNHFIDDIYLRHGCFFS
jgi:hypothetical protein